MAVDELLIGARVKWVPDHVKTVATIQPRHIGRIVQFDYFDNDDETDYEHISVLGTLEGYAGAAIYVSGVEYKWNLMADFRIYRQEIA